MVQHPSKGDARLARILMLVLIVDAHQAQPVPFLRRECEAESISAEIVAVDEIEIVGRLVPAQAQETDDGRRSYDGHDRSDAEFPRLGIGLIVQPKDPTDDDRNEDYQPAHRLDRLRHRILPITLGPRSEVQGCQDAHRKGDRRPSARPVCRLRIYFLLVSKAISGYTRS